MDGGPQTIDLDRKRIRSPSAATCAFVAGGLQIASSTSILIGQRALATAQAAGDIRVGIRRLQWWAIVATVIQLIMIAAQTKAFWRIARVQQPVAPISARLGQRAFILFLVTLLLVNVGMPIAVMAGNTTLAWPNIYTV